MTMHPAQSQVHKEMASQSLVWKNLTGLHRAVTSGPSNTTGMIWKAVTRALGCIQTNLSWKKTASSFIWMRQGDERWNNFPEL